MEWCSCSCFGALLLSVLFEWGGHLPPFYSFRRTISREYSRKIHPAPSYPTLNELPQQRWAKEAPLGVRSHPGWPAWPLPSHDASLDGPRVLLWRFGPKLIMWVGLPVIVFSRSTLRFLVYALLASFSSIFLYMFYKTYKYQNLWNFVSCKP